MSSGRASRTEVGARGGHLGRRCRHCARPTGRFWPRCRACRTKTGVWYLIAAALGVLGALAALLLWELVVAAG